MMPCRAAGYLAQADSDLAGPIAVLPTGWAPGSADGVR
jgi:hypothetical protein